MKIKYKPKQSTNNSTKRIIRDSNPKAIIGTLVGFITTYVPIFVLVLVSMFALTFITNNNSNNNVYAVSYEYSIKYNDNVVDNMPKDIYTPEGKAIGGNLTIANETPTRSGYKFLGWCNALPATTNGTESCSGATYQPSAGITITSATNFHFYAMWQEPTDYCKGSSYECMQNLTTCTTAAKDVIDGRDGEIYKVQQLADGKCWMLDNLRLDPATLDLVALQNKTNASDQTLTYLKNGGGTSPYATAAVADRASGFHRYDRPDVNTNYKNDAATDRGAGSGKIGVYYNYCAASAGSWCYDSSQPTSDPDPSTLRDAKEDLCPAGWRMPTGGPSGEYQALRAAYSNAADLNVALSIPLSGFFYNYSQGNLERLGDFWSSTYYETKFMYELSVDASGNTPSAHSYGRDGGLSIRCIAK